MINQCTIKEPVSISGVGIHTGQKVTMCFKPAKENHGYKFQRIDLDNHPIVEADIDNVVDVSRGTTIEKNGVRIHTVEHTLAALAGLEIDNVLIELDGPEPPIMDGSSQTYVDALLKAGIQEQSKERIYLELPENIAYEESDRGVEIIAIPAKEYKLTVKVDYNSPVLGIQHASVDSIKEFKKEIASARTFSFLHELEELVSNDLIKGGNIDNAIVVVDKVIEAKKLKKIADVFNITDIQAPKEGFLNNKQLHYANEPARHKLLDVVGDLALLGHPIKAHILATRPGHKANVEFARKIRAKIKQDKRKVKAPKYNPNNEPIFDINQVSKFLPHKYPFLLVDKVIELGDEHVVAVKKRHY